MRSPAEWLAATRNPRRIGLITALVAVFAGACLWFLPNLPRPRFTESWPSPEEGWEPWTPAFQGVDVRQANFSRPRPMKAHAVRIDLQAPGVEAVVHSPDPEDGGSLKTIYASDFLLRNGLQVAMSAGSFNPFPYFPGVTIRLDSLGINDGRQFSPQAPNLDSLLILKDRRAMLYRHFTPMTNHPNAIAGVGGMWINLLGGTNQYERHEPEAASVAGVSEDGRYLYWLIVDGRQPGYSEGATPVETGEMMRQLGAEDAINMDGGSVVTLVFDDGEEGFEIRNQPCHPFITGVQRPIGGIIGFKARAQP
jgi:hypothetical protein